ncbi:MAG: hypothetical protein ABIL46_09080, partial [candidate division WOR-3 bacterium]
IDEDTLCAFVFRTFYYVPVTFKKFWTKLREQAIKGSKAELSDFSEIIDISPWPTWSTPDKELKGKKTKRKESIEPDIVVETDTSILVVEAELTKNFEASQLVEQFLVSAEQFSDKKKEIFQLLLNKTLCYPGQLDDTIKEICKNHLSYPNVQKLLKHLLWFNWQGVIELFQECLELLLSDLERKIIWDTIKTMLKVENGILFPVTFPGAILKKMNESKNDITRLTKFLQEIISFDTRSLLNIQNNKDEVKKFIQYLENVFEKFQGG